MARDLINEALANAWEMESWPELILTEERFFRDSYDAAATYAAPTATSAVEVWWPPANRYYQTLRAVPAGQVPATVTGSTVTENSAYWAECASSYSGNTWSTGAVFTVGKKTLNPSDGRYYQCHTAHTAGASFDDTKFGVLTAFDRYVAHEQTGKTALGEVVRAFDKNPRIFRSVTEYAGDIDSVGIHFQAPILKVWLQFSRRCPNLIGSPLDVTQVITADTQYYWAGTQGNGNFYTATADLVAGNTPDSAPGNFSVVEIPYMFGSFIALEAYASFLEGADGQMEKARAMHQRAEEALEGEASKVWRRQHQVPRVQISTR